MSDQSTVQTPAVQKLSTQELTALIFQQQELLKAFETKFQVQEEALKKLETAVQPKRNDATREMTDEDARNILTGSEAKTKHKDAAAKLGLSYGQVYSCRLEFTFKHIHKEMKAKGIANPWVK